jgi:hypothetical protein
MQVTWTGQDVTITVGNINGGPSPNIVNLIVGILTDLDRFDRDIRSQIPELTPGYRLVAIDEEDDLSLEYDDEVECNVIYVTLKNGQATMEVDDDADAGSDDFN